MSWPGDGSRDKRLLGHLGRRSMEMVHHDERRIRLPPRSTPDDLFAAVRTLIGALERESIDGKLWIVQRGRIREYQPEEETLDP